MLTEGELKETPNDALVQKVISSVLEFVGELSNGEDEYERVRQAPKSAQFFWAMRLLESEVNNGGFEQYFWNSSCTLVDIALEAYQRIGADTYVDFVQRALAIMGSEPWATRRRQFDGDWRTYKRACPPALDELNNEFYAARRGSPESGGQDTSLYERKVEYIRQNYGAISAS